MSPTYIHPGITRAFLWTGFPITGAVIVCQLLLMGFVPGLSPALSAKETAKYFIEHQQSIQLGALLQCVIWTLYNAWGIGITVFIRKMERGVPILTYASIANCGCSTFVFVVIPLIWAVAAFHADTLNPDIIQMLNDVNWFFWLYSWPVFSFWMVIIGVAVLIDHNTPRIFPRWVGFFNFWCALLIVPAGLIGFFKTGPFAWDGAISFWFAAIVFFLWIVVLSIVGLQAVGREEQREAARSAAPLGGAPQPAE